MIEIILLAYFIAGLGTSRYLRTHKYTGPLKAIHHPAVHSKRCEDHFNSPYGGTRICAICPCEKSWIETPNTAYWMLLSAPFLWPLYAAGWFILTPNILPTKSIEAKTEALRIQNEKQLREIEDIEKRLKGLDTIKSG